MYCPGLPEKLVYSCLIPNPKFVHEGKDVISVPFDELHFTKVMLIGPLLSVVGPLVGMS